ncbi:MAG: dTDP-4-dehydrorhamnose reductase [Chlamydiae bacterium RIFCSPHIGHO2_12_FULL_49_11]|nr:MAG: dTDP-4-dehydrorhamnose reductase [Chlamydiae bacterium RIFCSPHIGHO2_12_FULL_49_11]
MKCWVVASGGLLGFDLGLLLSAKGIEWVGTSHSELDITSESAIEAFVEKERPTHIFNMAAYTDVNRAETEGKEEAYATNRDGPIHIAHVAKKTSARFIHVSTDYVFDGKKETDYTEDDPTGAVNEYGRSKLEGERGMFAAYPAALSVRTASLYGLHKDGHVAAMVKALQTQEEAFHITDQISTPTYTPDLAEALLILSGEKGIVHFVNGGWCSRFELLQEVLSLCHTWRVPVRAKRLVPKTQREVSRGATRPVRTVLSTRKYQSIAGKVPRHWKEALAEYFSHKADVWKT